MIALVYVSVGQFRSLIIGILATEKERSLISSRKEGEGREMMNSVNTKGRVSFL
jgi:hypothetical protein